MDNKLERVHNALPDVTKIHFRPISQEEKENILNSPEIREIFGLYIHYKQADDTAYVEAYEYNGTRVGCVCFYPESRQDAEAKHLSRATGTIADVNEHGQVIGYTSFAGIIDPAERPRAIDELDYPSVTDTFTQDTQSVSDGTSKNYREQGLGIRRLIALNKLINERYNESLRSGVAFTIDTDGKALGETVWLRLKEAGLAEVEIHTSPRGKKERRYKFREHNQNI